MPDRSEPSKPYPIAHHVRFWMSTPAITVGADAQVSEALAIMHEHRIRRVPVVDGSGQLCGIITYGDIRGAKQNGAVFAVMTSLPLTVGPNTSLRQAALLMLDNKIGGLPVVDDAHNIVGVVTESDLFEALVLYLDRSLPDA